MTNLRIGHGYDVHRLSDGRRLILGGVTIPYEKGLLGHSDADVLVHAVMDALLGAAALGDIGQLFPDTAGELSGISSMTLLFRVGKALKSEGYAVVNLTQLFWRRRRRSRRTVSRCGAISRKRLGSASLRSA